MFTQFLDRLLEGFLAPRRSAERLLSLAPDWKTVAELAILGFALQTVLSFATQLALEGTGIGPEVSDGETALTAGALPIRVFGYSVSLVVMTLLIYWIGRHFGGGGSLCDVAAVVCWHGVVTSLLAPLMTIGAMEAATGDRLGIIALILILSLFTIWLLASYIAAAHRYASPSKVFLAILGILFGLTFGLIMLGVLLVGLLASLGGGG